MEFIKLSKQDLLVEGSYGTMASVQKNWNMTPMSLQNRRIEKEEYKLGNTKFSNGGKDSNLAQGDSDQDKVFDFKQFQI